MKKTHWVRNVGKLNLKQEKKDKVANFYNVAPLFTEWVKRQQLIAPGCRVLDVGCGYGRMALALSEERDLSYLGLDTDKQAIQFCRTMFNEHKHMRFQAVDSSCRIPDGAYELGLAISLFPHLSSESQHAYMRELARVLDVGGTCLSTWNHGDGSLKHLPYDSKQYVAAMHAAVGLEITQVIEPFSILDLGKIRDRQCLGVWQAFYVSRKP